MMAQHDAFSFDHRSYATTPVEEDLERRKASQANPQRAELHLTVEAVLQVTDGPFANAGLQVARVIASGNEEARAGDAGDDNEAGGVPPPFRHEGHPSRALEREAQQEVTL